MLFLVLVPGLDALEDSSTGNQIMGDVSFMVLEFFAVDVAVVMFLVFLC